MARALKTFSQLEARKPEELHPYATPSASTSAA